MNFTAKMYRLCADDRRSMMNCKEALVASDGDINKAVEYLREKGLAAATKKAGRVAAEGAVCAVVKNGVGAIVEVNCETDFAAKNEKFLSFVEDVAGVVADRDPADLDALLAMPYPGSTQTVDAALKDNVLVMERISRSAACPLQQRRSVPYIHMGGKIGCS